MKATNINYNYNINRILENQERLFEELADMRNNRGGGRDDRLEGLDNIPVVALGENKELLLLLQMIMRILQ